MKVEVKRSTRKFKKYMAIFDDGDITHFGDNRYEDYTTHKDNKRKTLYLNRHKKNENWNNYKSAGSLSRYLLWNLPTLKSSINDYKRRFNLN